MKKAVLIILPLTLLLSCNNFYGLLDDKVDPMGSIFNNYMQTRAAAEIVNYLIIWDEYPGTEPSICFMGDSRVHGFPVNNYWTDRHMWNIAMSGSTLYGVELRIPQVSEFRPDIIYLSVGGNDIIMDKTRDWIYRYSAVIDELKTICSSIYISNIAPVAEGSCLLSNFNEKAPELNRQLEDLCLEKGVTYIELTELEDGNGNLKNDFTTDGIHFNEQAYDLLYGRLSYYF